MVQNWRFSSHAFSMGGATLAWLYASGLLHQQAMAQIIPDATLGAETSQVTRVSNRDERITGGAVRGSTLFHSFAEFNIRDGESAYFGPPGAIANIFSRVTGNAASDIFGTLGVVGNANLFLLNPNGIIFGPNARLDIGGSFVASTGDRVTFPDGSFFSANQPNTALPLLTVSLVPGLQLGTGQSSITNQGHLIAGGNLQLNGSELDLGGSLRAWGDLELVGGNRVQIRDTALVPFIAQAGESLTIEGEVIDIFALNHPNSGLVSGADMVLRSYSPLSSTSPSPFISSAIIGDAHYWSGGDFRIETTDGSLAAMTSSADPIIRAIGDVEIESYTGASLHILAGGSVRIPGQIQIVGPDTGSDRVENIQLSDGSTIEINGRTEPTLDIRAGVEPAAFGNGREPIVPGFGSFSTLTGDLAITDTLTTADIELGKVTFETFLFRSPISGTALITNQYEPNSTLIGDIHVESLVALGATVVIDARNSLQLVEGGFIEATPFPLGIPSTVLNDTASILLIAADKLTLEDGFRIQNNTVGNTTFSEGITIRAGTLQMSERSQISASSFSSQDGGDITILVQGSITLMGDPIEEFNSDGERINTSIVSTVNPSDLAFPDLVTPINTANSGGDIQIEGASLTMIDGATISSSVNEAQSGNSGDIAIRIDGDILIDGQTLSLNRPGAVTGIDTRLGESAIGRGGDITIRAQNLTLNSAGFPAIRTDSFGSGDAGNIRISLAESLELRNGSAIITDLREEAEGKAGTMIVNVGEVILQNGSLISTRTNGNGSGGRLSIRTENLRVQDSSSISSQTFGNGHAGDIDIQTRNGQSQLSITLQEQGSEISASTEAAGKGGNLNIAAPESLLIQGNGRLTASTTGGGQAGSIEITTGRLTLNDVNFSVESRENATGAAGDILVTADRASLNNTTLSAEPVNVNEGGNIDLQIGDRLFLNQSSISASTTNGSAGRLTLNSARDQAPTTTLRLLDSVLETQGGSTGNAGSILLNSQNIFLNNSSIRASTVSGIGGDIRLDESNQLVLQNESELLATTDSGVAGNVSIRALEFVQLTDKSEISVATDIPSADDNERVMRLSEGRSRPLSALRAATRENDTSGPVAGNLEITTGVLEIDEGSRIAVNSPTGQAGNIDIDSTRLLLDEGEISAATAVNSAGVTQASANININVFDLLTMSNGSFISAEAQNKADGGNIFLDASNGFIVALPNTNNDLIATADRGDGGSIQIFTEQLLGFQEYTGTRNPRQLPTNDMSVTSNLGTDGVISVNDLGVDPVQGAADLPVDTAPPPLSQGCTPGGGRGEFRNTGQGGIPLGPGDVRGSDRAWEDISPPHRAAERSIPEAQTWSINDAGQIVLRAKPTPQSIRLTCHNP